MNIKQVAKKLGLKSNQIQSYGNDKAKIIALPKENNGKLILVTALNPTSAGEGKTTVSIGLADAFNVLGKKVCLALREPSLGPVFGVKGGATGGGMSCVVPANEINLHFTGDFHAITSANNLLCAMIDNHIFQGNELNIKTVVFNRCLDVNDRALRTVILKDKLKGNDREEVFNITAASEIMAIMCMASNLQDLVQRLGNILVAYDNNDNPIFARQLKAENAMAILLKDALLPNLVQTLISTPAIIHCGPFANIAHGCNSVIATKLAMSYADYTVTEAGFGADLGAEKFLDFKCRVSNLNPDAVVIVATVKALKLHGGATAENSTIKHEELGICNLLKHIDNIKNVFNLPCVVAINKFDDDTKEELELIKTEVEKTKTKAIIVDVWTQSGTGATDLAKEIISICNNPKQKLKFCYELSDSIEEKCKKIAQKIYGAKDISLSEKARKDLEVIDKLKLNNLPVIIAKTQYSLSDDANLLGAPKDFIVKIKEFQIRNGAGFVVAIAGNMLLMPGLNSTPRATKMTISQKRNKINYKL